MISVIRFVVGYAIGISVFLIALPFAFWSISRNIDPLLGTSVAGFTLARSIAALLLFAVGAIFSLGSNLSLALVGRGGPTDGFGVAISPRTQRLVTTGVYRYTRNPMVFGTNLMYLALIVFLGSLAGAVALGLFICVLVPYVHWAEERRLVGDFGDAYLAYREKTSLFVPWPPRSVSRAAPTER
ncbi:MAG: isoprenylcysteine carboxylmethyltransferase family protein [Vicinamibacteria bacterium]|nr:isoprenylcysteine carboxylmethyltransferase family protein [Vicinamibacteria bacterium]